MTHIPLERETGRARCDNVGKGYLLKESEPCNKLKSIYERFGEKFQYNNIVIISVLVVVVVVVVLVCMYIIDFSFKM